MLQDRRAHAFRQRPSRRVRSVRAALAFVDAVGFCSTFYRFPEGVACLWEAVVGRASPRWPRRSHHDDGVGLTWQLKDDLPAAKHVYYGKLLRGRPVLVALGAVPSVLRAGAWPPARARLSGGVRGRPDVADRQAPDGRLRAEHPQYTRELRANTFLLEPSRTREFERAMAELQQGLWVVKCEERYEPTFSYRWDLVESWLPELVAQGRRLSRAAALDRLVSHYAAGAVFTTRQRLRRILGVSAAEIDACVARLARAGTLAETPVAGWPGRWLLARHARADA